MRKVNPSWHMSSNLSNNTNALSIYLEILQEDDTYTVKTWMNTIIGKFSNLENAQKCAKAFRTPLMSTTEIKDVRFIPDPKLLPPKPQKNEKIQMQPVTLQGVADTLPIIEDNQIVVEHPEDVISF